MSKKGEEGMQWYIIAAILSLIFLVIGFIIIGKSYSSGSSMLDFLREMF